MKNKKGFAYTAGTTFTEVFDNFKVPEDRREQIARSLLDEGYTERGVCYAAAIAENTLTKFIGDPRFAGILKNEVRKYAFKKGDPRWAEKYKR